MRRFGRFFCFNHQSSDTDQHQLLDPTDYVSYLLPDDGSRASFRNVLCINHTTHTCSVHVLRNMPTMNNACRNTYMISSESDFSCFHLSKALPLVWWLIQYYLLITTYYHQHITYVIIMNYIYRSSPYRAVNILRLGYTNQSVNAV